MNVETSLLVIYALAVWWGATGLILWLNGRKEATYRSSLIGAGILAGIGLLAAVMTRTWENTWGVLIGFTAAISVWAFNEMLFLMGMVVGRHEAAPPSGERGWPRFKRASLAIAHHEAALVLTLIALVAMFYGSENPTALWVFALLWSMRLSTKLNIHFGVPNTAAELLPARIAHLRAYFRTGPPSALFPISLTAAAAMSVTIYFYTIAPETMPHGVAAGTLLLTFALLGVLEHLLLAAPFPAGALWGWSATNAASTSTLHIDNPGHVGPKTSETTRQRGAA